MQKNGLRIKLIRTAVTFLLNITASIDDWGSGASISANSPRAAISSARISLILPEATKPRSNPPVNNTAAITSHHRKLIN
jgi:hypothetical protein